MFADLELIVSVPGRQERAEQYEADQKDKGALATASLAKNGLGSDHMLTLELRSSM